MSDVGRSALHRKGVSPSFFGGLSLHYLQYVRIANVLKAYKSKLFFKGAGLTAGRQVYRRCL